MGNKIDRDSEIIPLEAVELSERQEKLLRQLIGLTKTGPITNQFKEMLEGQKAITSLLRSAIKRLAALDIK